MAINNENVELQFLAVIADNPISVDIKCVAVTDVRVRYGNMRVLAEAGVDYAVELQPEDYDTFTVTPTAALITKINALIAGDPTNEVNVIHVRREVGFTSDFLAIQASLRQKIADEFDMTLMRIQQMQNASLRALRIPENNEVADLPPKNVRRGFILEFDPITGAPMCINTIQGVISGDLNATASAVAFQPTVDIVETNVQDAIEFLFETFGNPWQTGDVKLSIEAHAAPGWLICDDTTLGSLASTATHKGNDFLDLYKLLWGEVDDAYAPVSGGRGLTADADWAANKTIGLTKMLGRVLGVAGTGASLTARENGQALGAETHALEAAENAPHTHGVTDPGHFHNIRRITIAVSAGGNTADINATPPTGDAIVTEAKTTGLTVNSQGSGTAHNNMQPTAFLYAHIKL